MISKHGGIQSANIQGYFLFNLYTFSKANKYPIKYPIAICLYIFSLVHIYYSQ